MESGEKKARKDRNSFLLELRMTKHKSYPRLKHNSSVKLFKLYGLSL